MVKSAKKIFGGTFDPKTMNFGVFSNFAGDGPISWSFVTLSKKKNYNNNYIEKVRKFWPICITHDIVIADQSAGGL